jgi:DNA polymerase III delta prime subunit
MVDFISDFDNLFHGINKSRVRQIVNVQKGNKNDVRLDFYSALLNRLQCPSATLLRVIPDIFANHVEYVHTLLPLVIEDAVATIGESKKEEKGGGVPVQCNFFCRWGSSFTLLSCTCSHENRFRGNELLKVIDASGIAHWGVVKSGTQDEAPGQSSIEILILSTSKFTGDNLLLKVEQDTTSSLRQYTSVQRAPLCSLLPELMATKLLKKKRKCKQQQQQQTPTTEIDSRLETCFNPSQATAIRMVVAKKEGVTLIQGPPGTGKTRTILGIISLLLENDEECQQGIMVCAPSNTAVDELTRKLSEGLLSLRHDSTHRKQPRVLRVSAFGRGESCAEVLLRNVAKPSTSVIQALTKNEREAVETGIEDAFALGFHSYHIDEFLDKRDALRMSCRSTEWSARSDAIQQADVVLCTLSMAVSPAMTRAAASFKTVIIDEAAQAVEPDTLIPLCYNCKRLVLVGDPCQLPSTVRSAEAVKNKYERSMMERLICAGMPVHLLNTQYRMHPAIRLFPARYFYDDLLKDAEVLETVTKPFYDKWYFRPYLFFNLKGSTESVRGTSVCNDIEARFAVCLLHCIRAEFPSLLCSSSIITPYRAQVTKINHELDYVHVNKGSVEVNTIDGFQGKESDIVIFSTVRTRTEASYNDMDYDDVDSDTKASANPIGFLSDRRRMNVALTRAKSAFWIIGNADTLDSNPDWGELVCDVNRRGIVIDVEIDESGTVFEGRCTMTNETHRFF